MALGNIHSFPSTAFDNQTSGYILPLASEFTFEIVITSGASVAIQASFDGGTTWTPVDGFTAITTSVVKVFNGPLPMVRVAVTTAGSAVVRIHWRV